MSTVETEVTIKHGLPVRVRGVVRLAQPPLRMPGEAVAVLCPGWSDEVDDVEIFWRTGHPCQLALDDAEYQRIEGALIEEARRQAD